MAVNIEKIESAEFVNSLGSLVGSLYQGNLFPMQGYGEQISQSDTMWINNRWYMISNQRQLISQMYAEHGIVQTLVDQPVDDAFRKGIDIQSGELDGDDIEKLILYCERNNVFHALTQACKWARLYGGGGVMIISDQDPITPLNISAINAKTPLEFRAVDMWELNYNRLNWQGELEVNDDDFLADGDMYDYYGKKIHPSRVYIIKGKEPPSFIRPRLRGWGMSELERLVRSINQYLKNQNVIFELLDEAKIDVYKMKGFNASLLTAGGTEKVSQRIQHGNMIKNYNNALTMDVDDEYEQKSMTFTGLSEMLIQIRQGIAADLKMPVTKLFGISSAGFNSGEDDIENYNAMIEGEIRAKVKFHVIDLLMIACQKCLEFQPSDLTIAWPSLRVMSSKDEEEIKNHQYNRATSAYQMGAINRQEWAESVNKGNLLPVEVDENADAMPPLDGDFVVTSGQNVTE